MGLLSFFRNSETTSGAQFRSGMPEELLNQSRTRAKHRLIGATVLVLVAVIGLPMLLETQPRPLPATAVVQIEGQQPSSPDLITVPSEPALASSATAQRTTDNTSIIEETNAEVGEEVAPVAANRQPAAPQNTASQAAKPRATAAVTPARSEQDPIADLVASRRDNTDAEKSERWVVQVGAFTEADAVKDIRRKVESLGLKTYTQVADTSDGKRTRVRVGPFASRAEADKAAAKLKTAGVPTAMLSL